MRAATDTEATMPGRHRPVGDRRRRHPIARPAPPVQGPGARQPAGALSEVAR